MEFSIYLAQVFGVYLIFEGLFLLFKRAFLRKVLSDFMHSVALRYLAGAMMLIVGLVLVTSHNVWEWSWVGLITLISWLILLKSLLYLFAGEKTMAKIFKTYDKKGWYVVIGVIVLIAGIYLVRVGYGLY